MLPPSSVSIAALWIQSHFEERVREKVSGEGKFVFKLSDSEITFAWISIGQN